MKKCIILFLCCTSLPSCALFELPALLFTELVPLIIQYAPYALMFIEETQEKSIASNDIETFSQEIQLNIHKPVEEMDEWHLVYQKVASNNKKSPQVYLINLENITKERLLEIYSKMSSLGKVHYHFVKRNNNTEQLPEHKVNDNIFVYNSDFSKFK